MREKNYYGSLSRNWDPKTFRTLDVILEEQKK